MHKLLRWVLPSLLIASFAVSQDRFPEGVFAGKGLKTYADGTTKTYTLEFTIKGNQLNFSYQLPSGPVGYALELTYEKFGFFKVGTIGEGYCGASFCHYSVQLDPETVEEWTFLFDGSHLKKVGSLTGPKVHAYWDEDLKQK
ncbi:MAG: hypothetical protein HYR96_01595 [Deltaproteobacteria bacterium]|nr:hypothetical protein [Deltaproteobacteria bacterium]MBI3294411.1 hypothetical protein [Deltaproteobacteria bacterium]